MIKSSDKQISIAGFLGVFIFIISIFVATKYSHSFQNWYTTNEFFDWHNMAISHIGVSNLAIPFTIIVCLVSLLIIYFITGVKKHYKNKGLLKHGTSWIITGFIALMLAFIFLLYKPNSTMSIAIHFLFAIVYFTSIPVGIVMIGIHFVKKRQAYLGYSSLILGILAFIFGPIICMGSSILFGDKGVAIPEFIQIVCEDLWITLLGIDILKNKKVPLEIS